MSRSAFPARRPEPEQCGKHLDFGHSCHSRGIPLALKPGRIWQRAHLLASVRGLCRALIQRSRRNGGPREGPGQTRLPLCPYGFHGAALTLFSVNLDATTLASAYSLPAPLYNSASPPGRSPLGSSSGHYPVIASLPVRRECIRRTIGAGRPFPQTRARQNSCVLGRTFWDTDPYSVGIQFSSRRV